MNYGASQDYEEATMKAAFIEGTGAPDVIRYADLPSPKPTATQVLIRTEAVAVNPIDTYVRSGNVQMPLPMPYIVGCDVAGVVIGVGDAVKGIRRAIVSGARTKDCWDGKAHLQKKL